MTVQPKAPGILAALAILAGALPWGGTQASAQLVPVKSVPVAAGDQFLLYPAATRGLGGVGLALPDTLGDPFSNPATGSRIGESFFFASPTYYGISDRNGSGRSLPLGLLFPGDRWFGGVAASIQEITGAERNGPWFGGWGWDPFSSWAPPPMEDLSEASSRNLYGYGYLGRRFPERGLSVALAGSYADLGAVDGTELLYAMARDIDQSGHLSDLRLGLLKEWEGERSLEVVLLRESFRMRHEVTYLDVLWDPDPGEEWTEPQLQYRSEENLDHTDTWGAHVAYRRPLNDRGWRIGWSLTTNRKDHPKIPNYELQDIPRDPGDTWAHALGVGVARTEGPLRFAAELSLEPIRSDTWADAAVDTTTASGGTIPAGAKTIENEFRFTNVTLRTGASWDYRKATFQAGLHIRSIDYDLDQVNHIQLNDRTQRESWMEWTPSLGISLRLKDATIRYLARITTGTGRPGVRWDALAVPTLDNAGSDIILAPTGPLTLQDARVTTHQLAVVIPMR